MNNASTADKGVVVVVVEAPATREVALCVEEEDVSCSKVCVLLESVRDGE